MYLHTKVSVRPAPQCGQRNLPLSSPGCVRHRSTFSALIAHWAGHQELTGAETPDALPHVCCRPRCTRLCALARSALCDPTDCGPPGYSVSGVSQAGTLEGVAISFSRRSSRPRQKELGRVLWIKGKAEHQSFGCLVFLLAQFSRSVVADSLRPH